jgi:diaminopimelate epimerase
VIGRGRNGIDATMRILNADGGDVEACGNATRCVAQLLFEEQDAARVTIDTPGGTLVCTDAGGGNVTVDMGPPRFAWNEVPLSSEVDTNKFMLNVGGSTKEASAVSVGNPHCVIFVADADSAPVGSLGPKIETHPMFPQRTNVEFVSVIDRATLRMRVWERGVGITKACGTGACAAAAAAFRRDLIDSKVKVILDGGPLLLETRLSDGHLLMTGPSALAFRGELDLETFG